MDLTLIITVAICLIICIIEFLNIKKLEQQGYDMGRVPIKPKNKRRKK